MNTNQLNSYVQILTATAVEFQKLLADSKVTCQQNLKSSSSNYLSKYLSVFTRIVCQYLPVQEVITKSNIRFMRGKNKSPISDYLHHHISRMYFFVWKQQTPGPSDGMMECHDRGLRRVGAVQ